jgi:pyruvate/2-oxoglutarate/acetoin dehydrogenase E1 component
MGSGESIAAKAIRNSQRPTVTAALATTESSYFSALQEAMTLLSMQLDVVFMGQGVGVPGTTMSQTLEHVPINKRLEMPVAEDMQMGMAIGMSLRGYLPVCIFPRWNFLLLAGNQLINHLDRLPLYSEYRPKVIIRTAVPSNSPFDPGPQHNDDFTEPFSKMLRTVNVVVLNEGHQIMPAYERAIDEPYSTLLIEFTHKYRDQRANG